MAGYQFFVTIGILLANCVVHTAQNRDNTGSQAGDVLSEMSLRSLVDRGLKGNLIDLLTFFMARTLIIYIFPLRLFTVSFSFSHYTPLAMIWHETQRC